MNRLIDLSRHIPVSEPRLTVAYTPIRLSMPGRQALELRITAPAVGDRLPVVLLSHGYGPSNYIPSKDGYAPLVHFWAEQGFVVIQPTHASSRVGGLPADGPAAPFYWRERVKELTAILDRMDEVEDQATAIAGRLDRSRIAAAGHSFGGHTVGFLLGVTLHGESFFDPRISAGLLLATPGRGGKDLTEESAARFPFFDVDFGTLKTPSMVICGDEDQPHFTPRGPEWHADPYHDGPGARSLLTLHGAGHGLGGVAGLDARETEIEAPDLLEATKRLTTAWLTTALGVDAEAWERARISLQGPAASLASLEEK